MAVAGRLWVLSQQEEMSGYSSLQWYIPGALSSMPAPPGFLKSGSFEFGGERWRLRLYGNPYVYVFIYKQASPRKCNVRLMLSHRSPQTRTLKFSEEQSHTFPAGESEDCCFGIYTSFQLSDLASNDYRGLVLILSFGTNGEYLVSLPSAVDNPSISKPMKESPEHVDASTQTKSENSNSKPVRSLELNEASTQTWCDNYTEKLISDFSHLLDIGEESNLTVKVKGVEFRLHRGIMGVRTPVFSAMLRHEMKEKATGVVCMDDCEPEVFQAFVRYLYSGVVNELTTDTVFELFALAHMYQVDELKSACLKFIRCSVSVDTFCDVVNLALTYEQGELLRQATDFFAENMGDIVQTVKWMNYLSDHPIQSNELIVKAVQINSIKMKKLMEKK